MRLFLSIFLLQLIYRISSENISSRAYVNPFNVKSIDLFLVVDENPDFLTQMKFFQMKTVLSDIVTRMAPTGSSPYFGVYFYGAESVRVAVVFPTANLITAKTNLEQFQYVTAQSQKSTLDNSLLDVEASCRYYCRPGVARVVVVFAASLSNSSQAVVRRLEKELSMTFITVGIESKINYETLRYIASQPKSLFAISTSNIAELMNSASYLELVISEVPRSVSFNASFEALNVVSGEYYSLQVNVEPYTISNDCMIVFTTGCSDCRIFTSLTELRPTLSNSIQQLATHAAFGVANTFVYYYQVPMGAKRFFLSFRPNFSAIRIASQINAFATPSLLRDFPVV